MCTHGLTGVCEVKASDDALVIEGERGAIEALPLDDRTFLVDATDPDNPAVTFGAFDDGGRPGALYQMLWGLPRVEALAAPSSSPGS